MSKFNISYISYYSLLSSGRVVNIMQDSSDGACLSLHHINYLLGYTKMLSKHSKIRVESLSDILCVDLISLSHFSGSRFKLSYNFLSYRAGRFYIEVYLGSIGTLETLDKIYLSANWLEREVWDMFGIFFIKSKDLRRILTDYGFNGFPLRKDYPVVGFDEVRYDDELKIIMHESVEFAQEFRSMSFEQCWVGLKGG